MRKILLLLSLLLSPLVASAQFVVTDYGDIGDSTIDDGIYFPKTLRSAIQNANYAGAPASIEFGEDYANIKVGTDLPAILVPMQFSGDGLTLEPAVPNTLVAGLIFDGNNSSIKKTIIQNFGTHGLVWRGDDGLIENITARHNGNTQLQVWEAHRNQIGTDVTSEYASNQYYGGKYGIFLFQSEDNIVHRNFVGTNTKYDSLGCEVTGIVVDKCFGTIIRYNVVGWNGEHGIWIDGFSSKDVTKFHSSFNYVHNNSVGTSLFGSPERIPNGMSGVWITNSTLDSVIGNVVAGNRGTGIHVQSTQPGSSTAISGGVVIEDNKVGVDRFGKKMISNGRGIYVLAKDDIIRNNIVSGNVKVGIEINGADNVVQSNIVGLNAEQDSALPNGIGIAIDNGFDEGHAVIGDTSQAQQGNVVAGNRGAGIYVFGAGTQRVIVAQNDIGINKADSAIPNGGDGIHMKYSLRDILVEKNDIGASGGHGIRIERNVVYYIDPNIPPFFQRPSNITIRENCFGCVKSPDTNGVQGGSGIYILNADSIWINDNSIAGTTQHGIHVDDSVQSVWITKNEIGPLAFLKEEWLEPGGDGIRVEGANTDLVIVGNAVEASEANYIALAKGHGVSVQKNAQGVFVYANTFLDNDLGGIALDNLKGYFDNNNFNDAQDADNGSNELQNTLDQYIGFTKDSRLWLSGSFRGKPNTDYSYDLYLARTLPSGEEHRTQGTEHLGWFTFTTNAAGTFEINRMWDDPRVAQWATEFPFATVTITGPDGTSSFSHLGVREGVDVAIAVDTLRTTVDEKGKVSVYASVMNLGGDPATTFRVRDTVSNFRLDSVSISKGIALIADSTFVATIPSLARGEVVEYKAVGQALEKGTHYRRLIAIPSEVDENPANNVDTVQLVVLEVNDVSSELAEQIDLTIVPAGLLNMTGFSTGSYVVRCSDLLGRVYDVKNMSIGPGMALLVELQSGVNIIEVMSDERVIYRAKVLLRN